MKAWYESKTLWVNVIGLLVVIGQYLLDKEWLDPVITGGILAFLNLILRFLTTEPIGSKDRPA